MRRRLNHRVRIVMLVGAAALGLAISAVVTTPFANAASGRRLCTYLTDSTNVAAGSTPDGKIREGDTLTRTVLMDFEKDGSCPTLKEKEFVSFFGVAPQSQPVPKITCEEGPGKIGPGVTVGALFSGFSDMCDAMPDDQIFFFTFNNTTGQVAEVASRGNRPDLVE